MARVRTTHQRHQRQSLIIVGDELAAWDPQTQAHEVGPLGQMVSVHLVGLSGLNCPQLAASIGREFKRGTGANYFEPRQTQKISLVLAKHNGHGE